VRLDAFPENGSVTQSPPDACTLTSENVTSNAFASLNGLSFNITVSVAAPPAGDGETGFDELDPLAEVASPLQAALNNNTPVDLLTRDWAVLL